MTSRPDKALIDRFAFAKPLVHSIEADGWESWTDVRKYVKERCVKLPGAVQPKTQAHLSVLIDNVCKASGGNFLVAQETLNELQSGSITVEQLLARPKRSVPQTLTEYYREFFERQLKAAAADWTEVWRAQYRPLFEVLIAQDSPLTESRWCSAVQLLVGQKRGTIEFSRQLKVLQHFLHASSGLSGWSLYHKSLADWLVTNDAADDFAIDVKAGHRALAALELFEGATSFRLSENKVNELMRAVGCSVVPELDPLQRRHPSQWRLSAVFEHTAHAGASSGLWFRALEELLRQPETDQLVFDLSDLSKSRSLFFDFMRVRAGFQDLHRPVCSFCPVCFFFQTSTRLPTFRLTPTELVAKDFAEALRVR